MIRFSQRSYPLAEIGIVAECRRLPQDKYTAAAVLAVLVSENPDPWPGAYMAHVDDGSELEPLVVDTDDLLVKRAKEMVPRFGRSDLKRLREEIRNG